MVSISQELVTDKHLPQRKQVTDKLGWLALPGTSINQIESFSNNVDQTPTMHLTFPNSLFMGQ